ncbi:YncE family protein [Candidatus Nitrosocosmicus hydrocola]|uniref:YncE family protein n=1 Tax=Candidatus Nitrosocosmicus hydrocola TaxID=1826872 RepID=UPI0011E5D41C|nr:hypothetical protein [Candidatus Nitrosocosmicus hydrocola]
MQISLFVIIICTFAITLFTSTLVIVESSGHRDGCHRWHSCPSDSGSYSCGDTGHDSECSGSNNDDEDESDNDNDNDKRTSDFDFDFSNSESNNEQESDSTNDNNKDEKVDCLDGFYRNFDGECKSILSDDVENNEVTDMENNSVFVNPVINNEGNVFKASDKKNTFYDYSDNLLYVIKDSKQIVAINDKNLVNKITVKDIQDPVYNTAEKSLYFLDSDNKINVFDGSSISLIDTDVKINDLEYNPSNGFIYATSTGYGKIFVIDNRQIVSSLDVGLGQVDYLVHNPSNGYMYGVDKNFLKNVVIINGKEIVNSIPTGKYTNINYLVHNPSNGYMYGVDNYRGKIMILDSTEIKGNLSIGYEIDSLAYEPVNGYMYVIGNEIKKQESDDESGSTSLTNSILASNTIQPVAQIQQFNQDTGSGPACCNTVGGTIPGQTDSSTSLGSPTNGKITIINGTEKFHNFVFNDLIENIEYNPIDDFLYVLTSNPGRVSLVSGTDILDQIELEGNPKKILFSPLDGLAYITKENNYEYSIDVFYDEFLKSNIPIKYLYDEIVTNPSQGLVYMLEGDILYLIKNGFITDKIILNSE